MSWLVVRYISNHDCLDHISKCGEYATRDDAEKSAQLMRESHNEIAGAALFVVREMRVRDHATN